VAFRPAGPDSSLEKISFESDFLEARSLPDTGLEKKKTKIHLTTRTA
jgi:hypothetical protein